MKRRIVHVAYAHPPLDTRILYKECVSLAKKEKYEVIYLTSNKSGSSEEEFNESGVNIRVLPLKEKRFVRLIEYLSYMKNYLIELDGDLYHIHEPWLLPLAKHLKKNGKIVVVDMHEYYRYVLPNRKGFIKSTIGKLYYRYEKNILPKVDAVIFPCRILGEDPFKDLNLKRPTTYIDNYVKLEEMEWHTDSATQGRSLTSTIKGNMDRCPLVTYSGSISESRGIKYLIKGVYKAGARLMLAGWFSSKEYKNELSLMPEWECVTFLGKISRSEISELNNICQVGAATLLNAGQYYMIDNLPTKVYEYMLQKLPVIISDTPYASKIIKEYPFGIAVDPTDPDKIAAAINEIASNSGLAKEMGEQGKKLVLERFNWGMEEKKLYSLYEELFS